ncbi:MAG: 4Fe-4S binding protein [Candidatus Coatesbacteria bacterium]|nr:4Fe-4S binding protein [Candidatus Coatesbacteria bacterium]
MVRMNRRYFLKLVALSTCGYIGYTKLIAEQDAKAVYKVDESLCINCGICMSVCEAGAITLGKKHASIDMSKCISCGKCKDACPKEAIYETSS